MVRGYASCKTRIYSMWNFEHKSTLLRPIVRSNEIWFNSLLINLFWDFLTKSTLSTNGGVIICVYWWRMHLVLVIEPQRRKSPSKTIYITCHSLFWLAQTSMYCDETKIFRYRATTGAWINVTHYVQSLEREREGGFGGVFECISSCLIVQ